MRWALERKLAGVRTRLVRARDELRVLEEQALQFRETEEETRLQAMVSDSPADRGEHRDAHRHATAFERSREELRQRIAELEKAQDDLLDRLVLRSR